MDATLLQQLGLQEALVVADTPGLQVESPAIVGYRAADISSASAAGRFFFTPNGSFPGQSPAALPLIG